MYVTRGERKRERRKPRRKTETLYHVFSERQTREKETAFVKRIKDRKRETSHNEAYIEKERG